jgi:hypothetical protein
MKEILDLLLKYGKTDIPLYATLLLIISLLIILYYIRPRVINLILNKRISRLKEYITKANITEENPFEMVKSENISDSKLPIVIERIQISNFKNIQNIEIDFSYHSELNGNWTCIVGINGAGKTSILQATSLILLGDRLVTELGRERLRSLIRQSGSGPCEIKAIIRQGHKRCLLYLPIGEGGVDENRLSLHKDYSLMRSAWDSLERQLVVGYGASRSISDFSESRYRNISRQVQRQISLFDPLAQITDLSSFGESDIKDDRIFQTLILLVQNTFDLIDIKLKPKKEGNRILFEQYASSVNAVDLPDGYRSIIAWYAELCNGWHRLGKQNSPIDPRTIYGIILLDEIGLHLHPSLERSIVQVLRKVLPNIQFIVTTHSPLVIGSFDRSELIILDKHEEDGIRQLDRQVFGFSTDEIYNWLMDTTPYSKVIEDKLIDRNDPDLAILLYQDPLTSEEEARELLEKRRQILREIRSENKKK